MSYTLMELIKLSKNGGGEKVNYKLGIIGNDATQHLKNAVRGMGIAKSLNIDVFDADYNQIEIQVLNPMSELYEFNPDIVLISMCIEKLFEDYEACVNKVKFAEEIFSRLNNYYTILQDRINAKIIQFTFVEENDRIFGNFGLSVEESFIYQVRKLNYLMMENAAKNKNVFLVDINDIRAKIGADTFCDKKFYCSAKMAVSTEALPYLAEQIVDIILAINGNVKKCVVLDLDNTLWGGVIGDDGMDGIQLGELGIGHAYTELQLYLKQLKERGIILCVCSKNNEDTAKEPFISHPDMILRLDDIAMFVANWEDKATNIRYIQKTLNIGMDSIVFLDDNPFERNLVREMIPDITVPELPEDAVMYCDYVKSLNLFETVSFSKNDADRTAQYQQEANRAQLMNSFVNFDDYLKGLEMIGEAKPFEKYYYPRIAQLTQRSNQFNLRTVRYTEAEIESIAESDAYITLYYTLKDRFGDNGLVSLVIMEKQDAETLFVNEWLMSCRVLKRGMEEFVVNEFVNAAKEAGYKKIIGEYIQTKKNAMVKDLYQSFGFEKTTDNRYILYVDEYEPRKHFIEKV